jgi:hypothetical protein
MPIMKKEKEIEIVTERAHHMKLRIKRFPRLSGEPIVATTYSGFARCLSEALCAVTLSNWEPMQIIPMSAVHRLSARLQSHSTLTHMAALGALNIWLGMRGGTVTVAL